MAEIDDDMDVKLILHDGNDVVEHPMLPCIPLPWQGKTGFKSIGEPGSFRSAVGGSINDTTKNLVCKS